jgi:hypothetical protein
MLPPFAPQNSIGGVLTDALFFSECGSCLTSIKANQDFAYIGFRQLGAWIALSTKRWQLTVTSISALLHHVAHVISIGALSQVSGITAGRVVTDHVPHFLFSGPDTGVHPPSHAVRSSVPAVNREHTVAPLFSTAKPGPALVWATNVHLGPETSEVRLSKQTFAKLDRLPVSAVRAASFLYNGLGHGGFLQSRNALWQGLSSG